MGIAVGNSAALQSALNRLAAVRNSIAMAGQVGWAGKADGRPLPTPADTPVQTISDDYAAAQASGSLPAAQAYYPDGRPVPKSSAAQAIDAATYPRITATEPRIAGFPFGYAPASGSFPANRVPTGTAQVNPNLAALTRTLIAGHGATLNPYALYPNGFNPADIAPSQDPTGTAKPGPVIRRGANGYDYEQVLQPDGSMGWSRVGSQRPSVNVSGQGNFLTMALAGAGLNSNALLRALVPSRQGTTEQRLTGQIGPAATGAPVESLSSDYQGPDTNGWRRFGSIAAWRAGGSPEEALVNAGRGYQSVSGLRGDRLL